MHDLRSGELREGSAQRRGIEIRHGLDEFVGELPPQRRGLLSDLFRGAQAIEARHQ